MGRVFCHGPPPPVEWDREPGERDVDCREKSPDVPESPVGRLSLARGGWDFKLTGALDFSGVMNPEFPSDELPLEAVNRPEETPQGRDTWKRRQNPRLGGRRSRPASWWWTTPVTTPRGEGYRRVGTCSQLAGMSAGWQAAESAAPRCSSPVSPVRRRSRVGRHGP